MELNLVWLLLFSTNTKIQETAEEVSKQKCRSGAIYSQKIKPTVDLKDCHGNTESLNTESKSHLKV